MNKKAQYYPTPSYSSVHPVLIIGIAMFITPFFFPVIGYSSPDWLSTGIRFFGIVFIFIGGALSIIKKLD